MGVEAPADLTALDCLPSCGGRVVDVGCGTGRVAAHLAAAGVDVLGVDLSPGMVAVAAAAHPTIPFAVGRAEQLPLRSSAVAGLVSWYSLIHLPGPALPQVLAEFARVLRPRAPVVLAFQTGAGERVDRASSYGHEVAMTYYRHSVDGVAEALVAAGFVLLRSVRREAELAHESTAQGFVVAERDSG